MDNLVNRIYMKLLKKISYKAYTKSIFKLKHGYELNLKNPRTFNEKIQWMKFYGHIDKLYPFIDKNDVRDYVREKVGANYLIPQIGCYSKSRDIDFNSLPKRFVIKATHASGWNLVIENKENINIQETKRKIDRWIKDSFYKLTGEINYKNIKGRVVIEEFIEDVSGDLMDYRFFCYNGEPKFVQLDSYADTKKRRNIYNTEWNLLDCKCSYENILNGIEKPFNFDEMLNIAKKLSEGFNFVRVDLYNVNGRVYFGELTFTPQNGMGEFNPVEYDYKFGESFELKSY